MKLSSSTVVGLGKYLPLLCILNLSSVIQLLTAHYPVSNTNADITQGHWEKSNIIGER